MRAIPLIFAALAALSGQVIGQPYPAKTVKMLVPFPPGGVSDASARLVADQLTKRLGQQIVVENRPGASGNISGQLLVQAEPDGYSIMLGYNGLMTINPHVFASMPFDTVKDLAPIGKIGDYPSVITVHPRFGVNSLMELVAFSKSRSEGISYGTSGPGSVEHLIAVLFTQRTGANLVHVPYKGAGPALADAMAGHIPMALTSVAGGHSHIKAGRLKGLAVSSVKRSSTLPDVPTFIEGGVSNFVVNSWIGLIAPGKTPRPIVDRLNAELNASLATQDLRERLNTLGIDVTPGTPASFADEVKRELEMNRVLVKAAGIKPQ